MSVIQDIIPEIIPREISHLNIGPVLSVYGATDI
jgi:hypothetical protein